MLPCFTIYTPRPGRDACIFGFVVENCKIQGLNAQTGGGVFSFDGNITGDVIKIKITITMDYYNGKITYTGQVNADKNKITGTWTLSTSWSGIFTQSGSGTWEVTK